MTPEQQRRLDKLIKDERRLFRGGGTRPGYKKPPDIVSYDDFRAEGIGKRTQRKMQTGTSKHYKRTV